MFHSTVEHSFSNADRGRNECPTWSMMTGLSTLVSVKKENVTFLTIPEPTPWPANAFMRAPFWALDILMKLDKSDVDRVS